MSICARSLKLQRLLVHRLTEHARFTSRRHHWRLLSAAAIAASPIALVATDEDSAVHIPPVPAAHAPPPVVPVVHVSSWKRWRRLFASFGSDVIGLVVACALGVAAVSVGLMTPMVLAEIWDALSSSDSTSLILPVLKLAGVILARFVLQLTGDMLKVSASEGIASRLRSTLYAALLARDMAAFDARPSHDFVACLMDDVREIRDALRTIVGDGIPAVARAIGSAVALTFISPRMTAAVATVFPAALYLGNVYAARLRALSRASAEAQARTTAVAGESLSLIRTVRAFAAEPVEVARLRDLLAAQTVAHERVAREVSLFRAGMTLGLGLLGGGVLAYGGALVQRGDMSRSGVAAFAMETFTLEQSLTQLSALWGRSTRATGAADRVCEALEEHHVALSAPPGATWSNFKGDVVFDNVSFAYPTRRDAMALDGVTLQLRPGSVVALAGPSGSGKSTVCQLLLGFYKPCSATGGEAGMVRVDGRPLHDFVDLRWFRSHCGYVLQDPAMFRASVRDNISYGYAAASEEDVIEAAKAANAWDFISAMPQGLDTIVGERGAALSGGALDAESEALVQQALNRMQADGSGRTVLIIAHRLSTIAAADVIYVMERGRVVESGSHGDLVLRGGKYASLVARQREIGSNDADFDGAAAADAEGAAAALAGGA